MWIPLHMAEWCIPFWFTLTLTLTSDLISRFLYLDRNSFITNNLPQMCLMLDQFLWGHSSCYCEISCLTHIPIEKMDYTSFLMSLKSLEDLVTYLNVFMNQSQQFFSHVRVRKRAKIMNRCNQAPHLTQDTNGIVTSHN